MSSKRFLSHAHGYLDLGMFAEAAAQLDQIAGPDADTPEVLVLRLAILHEQQNWPAVRAIASDLARRTPEDAAIWVTWAYAVRRDESLVSAQRILLDAISHHPVNGTIQFNLACYACQLGDLPRAGRHLELALAIDRSLADLAATDPDLAPLRAAKPTDCQPSD